MQVGASRVIVSASNAGRAISTKLVLGLPRASRREISFCGRTMDVAARAEVGFLPEQSYFYERLTVAATLDFNAQLYGAPARATSVHPSKERGA